ncbi:hypothetical protein FMK81_13095 [Klebsiella oxytoca]|uniref:hypothetical protein n=1 Tax=Klebsiella oxytoca TaxID=571 RepID=UPI001CCB44B7|nr:hypothetical protein [Klebsiella oxytoca]MBZ7262444.1 hypothetical protein [Klebsiella oxytoca]
MTTDITELTGAPKHANQHRLSRLIIEASNDELRQLAVEVEQYTDHVIEALEKSQDTITEMDNRIRKQNRHVCELFDDNTALRQRISELETNVSIYESAAAKHLERAEAAERESENWRVSFDNERFRADKLAAELKTEHEQLVLVAGALITQHTRANNAQERIAYLEKRLKGTEESLIASVDIVSELESLTFTTAATDVLAERQRQITAEGWTPEHDDEYQHCEMAVAAACYIMADDDPRADVPELWPWPSEWWKPTDVRRDLVKAGALILAEIERLDRATGTRGG